MVWLLCKLFNIQDTCKYFGNYSPVESFSIKKKLTFIPCLSRKSHIASSNTKPPLRWEILTQVTLGLSAHTNACSGQAADLFEWMGHMQAWSHGDNGSHRISVHPRGTLNSLELPRRKWAPCLPQFVPSRKSRNPDFMWNIWFSDDYFKH